MKKLNPATQTMIKGKVIAETSSADLKAVGKKARRALPEPPSKDSKIKPYKKSIKSSPGSPAANAGVIPGSTAKGELKGAGALQTVKVQDTYRMKRKGGILRLQKVSGHKRSLTKKRLRREGKI